MTPPCVTRSVSPLTYRLFRLRQGESEFGRGDSQRRRQPIADVVGRGAKTALDKGNVGLIDLRRSGQVNLPKWRVTGPTRLSNGHALCHTT